MSNEELTKFVAYAAIIQGFGTVFIVIALAISLWQSMMMRRALQQNDKIMDRNNTINQMTQYQSALQFMLDWRSDVINDVDLVESFRKEAYFVDAFKILPEREYFHTIKLFHTFEHFWLLNKRGVIPSDMWQPWSNNMTLVMRQTKKQEIWRLTTKAGIFNSEFAGFVNSLIAKAEAAQEKGGAAKDTTVASNPPE